MAPMSGATIGAMHGDGTGQVTVAPGSPADDYVQSLPQSPDQTAQEVGANTYRVSNRAYQLLAGTYVTPPPFTGGIYL
jgi:hypothetical protein